jgi:hypothetical protein
MNNSFEKISRPHLIGLLLYSITLRIIEVVFGNRVFGRMDMAGIIGLIVFLHAFFCFLFGIWQLIQGKNGGQYILLSFILLLCGGGTCAVIYSM